MKVTMTGEGLAHSVRNLKPLDVFKYQSKTLMIVAHTAGQVGYTRRPAMNTRTGILETVPLTAIVRKIGTMEIVAE